MVLLNLWRASERDFSAHRSAHVLALFNLAKRFKPCGMLLAAAHLMRLVRSPVTTRRMLCIVWVCLTSHVGCDSDSFELKRFRVGSNSMAPRWLGPTLRAHCDACKREFGVDAESYNPNFPTRCHRCGATCSVSNKVTMGQLVDSEPVRDSMGVQRLDVIVFREPGAGPIVKRIWGMPHEQVELKNGELWIDGHLFQKTISQFAMVGIPLSRFPEDDLLYWTWGDGDHSPVLNDTLHVRAGSVMRFAYHTPAPIGSNEYQRPSPILNDYEINQGISTQLHPVDDLLVSLKLRDIAPDLNWRLTLHYRKQDFSFQFSGRTPTLDNRSDFETKAIEAISHLPVATNVMAAVCDSRIMISIEQLGDKSEYVWELDRVPGASRSDANALTESKPLSPCEPIEIYPLTGDLLIEHLEVSRDLWLGPRQHRELMWSCERPIGENRFWVLGDNLPVSLDCREKWNDGIPSAWIEGRLR